jgi:hypothetical protein
VLEQSTHHGLEWDPLHEACNLPDLLGMRPLGAFTAAVVRRHLPRVTRQDLLSCMQVAALQTADGPVELIPRAALAAAALPSLKGKSPDVLAARRAALEVIGSRLSPATLADLFGVTTHAIRELRRRPADARLVQAIRLQLGLIQIRANAVARLALPFEKAS